MILTFPLLQDYLLELEKRLRPRHDEKTGKTSSKKSGIRAGKVWVNISDKVRKNTEEKYMMVAETRLFHYFSKITYPRVYSRRNFYVGTN